jgi:tRNA threonylcarbamoyladenosine biosynthesis protein TsaE
MLIELPNQILNTSDETADLAARIGAQLRIGDTLLLQGDIGAGKSFFARTLIQSLQDRPEDVPSPTFTLVQTYITNIGEVWHADLYRLNDPSEAEELGLAEAFSDAICLIEWPDRLANLSPPDAITLSFTTLANDDMRQISFLGGSQALRSRISKALL